MWRAITRRRHSLSRMSFLSDGVQAVIATVLTAAVVERRRLAALAEPIEGAEGRKRALLDCLRVLGQANVRHALVGDMALALRAMCPSSMRLEMAVGGLRKVPWGALQAEGYILGRTSCARLGTTIRFRKPPTPTRRA